MIGKIKNFLFVFSTFSNKEFLGSQAYQDLVKILQHPDFCVRKLPLSITMLKDLCYGLPIMTLNSHRVKINYMHTPSTTKLEKEGYTFSILDHIQCLINNLRVYSQLYFGSGVQTNKVVELWQGRIWKESPLFGETSLLIDNSKFLISTFFLISKLIITNLLPHCSYLSGWRFHFL